jgi:3-oxoacyl-[acyl-carrier protein] reductase
VIVTGAGRGIGEATAMRLAAEGAHVVVTYRHDQTKAEHVAAAIERMGGQAAAGFFDLDNPGSMRPVAECAMRRWNRIDALVNNAVNWAPVTSAWHGPFEEYPDDQWQPLLRANIEGPFVAIQSVLPFMRRQGWGRIVNISSVAAVDGMSGFGWYSAAKAALHGLTETLARELGPSGILVNVVMPGATATERVVQNMGERLLARQAAALPTRRLPQPDDVARLVVFLASAANSATTGEVLRASGGRP